jgi:hypothetical protein
MIFNVMYDFLKDVAEFLDDGDCLDVTLAMDSTDGYWRRELYAPYKADRAQKRRDDGVDWDRAYLEFARLSESIARFTPWKVLRVRNCEADDIIYALSKSHDGPVIIHSGDSDYLQLVSENVSLYLPHVAEYAEFPRMCKIAGGEAYCRTPEEYLQYAILTGQGGKDNVYNVKTPTDWDASVGKRKPGFGVAAAGKVLSSGNVEATLDALGLLENYRRNKVLIDMRELPKCYFDAIIDAYEKWPRTGADIAGLLSVYDWPSMVADADKISAELTMFAHGIHQQPSDGDDSGDTQCDDALDFSL